MFSRLSLELGAQWWRWSQAPYHCERPGDSSPQVTGQTLTHKCMQAAFFGQTRCLLFLSIEAVLLGVPLPRFQVMWPWGKLTQYLFFRNSRKWHNVAGSVLGTLWVLCSVSTCDWWMTIGPLSSTHHPLESDRSLIGFYNSVSNCSVVFNHLQSKGQISWQIVHGLP